MLRRSLRSVCYKTREIAIDSTLLTIPEGVKTEEQGRSQLSPLRVKVENIKGRYLRCR